MYKEVKDLLIPRYKVVGEFPGYAGHKGQVLTEERENRICVPMFVGGNKFEYVVAPDVYPHLFKKLEWHQDRDKTEMPKHVKWTNPGTKDVSFFEIVQWLSNSAGVYTAGTSDAYLFIKDVAPATKEEYDEYIKSKEK